jgi:pimeloyl-ACP methyl ester carboxylesterase
MGEKGIAMIEATAQFGPQGALTGVMTRSDAAEAETAVLLLNAGIIHRSGPNRLSVTLGRALAAAGFPTLRFDFSGIGDSKQRGGFRSPRERFVSDTQEAIAYCQKVTGAKRIALVGNCYGGVVAFETALVDARVAAICLVNAQNYLVAPVDASQQEARVIDSYYVRFVLFRTENWRRFLTGRSNYRRLGRAVLRAIRRSAVSEPVVYPQALRIGQGFDELSHRRLPVLIIYSAEDVGILELEQLTQTRLSTLAQAPGRELFMLHKTDHFITPLDSQLRLIDKVVSWAQEQAIVNGSPSGQMDLSERALASTGPS